jgi:hypothetical protein
VVKQEWAKIYEDKSIQQPRYCEKMLKSRQKAVVKNTSNQNEQQRFNYNVLTHDVMGKMVLVER